MSAPEDPVRAIIEVSDHLRKDLAEAANSLQRSVDRLRHAAVALLRPSLWGVKESLRRLEWAVTDAASEIGKLRLCHLCRKRCDDDSPDRHQLDTDARE